MTSPPSLIGTLLVMVATFTGGTVALDAPAALNIHPTVVAAIVTGMVGLISISLQLLVTLFLRWKDSEYRKECARLKSEEGARIAEIERLKGLLNQ